MVQTGTMLDVHSPEIMRHVPSPRFLADKIDQDVRRAVVVLGENAGTGSAAVADLSRGLRRLALLLNVDTKGQAVALIDSIVSALRNREEVQFRRRTPEDRFVRGKGERIWSASAALFATLHTLLDSSARSDGTVVMQFYGETLPAIPELRLRDGGAAAGSLTSG